MKTPYLSVVDMPRKMAGKGAPQPTIFGVIGRTHMESSNRVLGGLVVNTQTDRMPHPVAFHEPKSLHTEKGASSGKKPATHINGHHFGQVPYAGRYMGPLGKCL